MGAVSGKLSGLAESAEPAKPAEPAGTLFDAKLHMSQGQHQHKHQCATECQNPI